MFELRTLAACFLVFFTLLHISAQAQQDKSKRPSPPATATAKIGTAEVSINYSQPSVKGRQILGGIVPYGKVWRTGANEATVFETSADITVEGKTLPAGKYGLFTIPGENEWVVIFNKNFSQWGSSSYSEADDVLRVNVKPAKQDSVTEQMTFTVAESGQVALSWDTFVLAFTVAAK